MGRRGTRLSPPISRLLKKVIEKAIHQGGLAHAGLAREERDLTLALPCACEAGVQPGEFPGTTNEMGEYGLGMRGEVDMGIAITG